MKDDAVWSWCRSLHYEMIFITSWYNRMGKRYCNSEAVQYGYLQKPPVQKNRSCAEATVKCVLCSGESFFTDFFEGKGCCCWLKVRVVLFIIGQSKSLKVRLCIVIFFTFFCVLSFNSSYLQAVIYEKAFKLCCIFRLKHYEVITGLLEELFTKSLHQIFGFKLLFYEYYPLLFYSELIIFVVLEVTNSWNGFYKYSFWCFCLLMFYYNLFWGGCW